MSNLTQELLRPLVERYDINAFIESGCYLGDGIQTALDSGVKSAFSCDVWIENVNKCRERFKDDKRVRIDHCKGFQLLDEFEFIDIYKNCLFWLDGHLPGHYGYPVEDPMQFELIKELEVIATLDDFEHVILCDDAWLFKDHPDYEKSPENYRQDITCEQIYKMFPNHHGKMINVEQGIILLEPI